MKTTDIIVPELIIFDLDDTILAYHAAIEPSMIKAFANCASIQPIPDTELLKHEIHDMAEWYWSDLERHRIGRADLRQARYEVITLALKKLGIVDDRYANTLATERARLHEEYIDLFPGAIETIKQLRSANYKLGMITNGAANVQNAKIDRFNLRDYFDFILVEGEIGYGKPDDRIYADALKITGVEAKKTWMVGDNLHFDILAAQQQGIFTVWNDHKNEGLTKDSVAIPDMIIHSITELPAILKGR